MSKPRKQAQILIYLATNNSYGRPLQDLFKSSYLLGFCFLFIKFLFCDKACKSLRAESLVLFKLNHLFEWFAFIAI